MKLITLNKITDGMVLAKNIYTRRGNVLLAKDARLKKSYVNRLQEWGVKSAYVVDAQGDVVEIDQELYRQAKDDLIQLVKDFYAELSEEQFPASLKQTMDEIISKLLSDDNVLQSLVEVKATNEKSFRNSVMTSVLSIILGNSLGYDINQLSELAAGAIFIQSGKIELAKKFFDAKDSSGAHWEIPAHCRETLDRLWKFQDNYESAAGTVLEHYEKDENDSFPEEVQGTPNIERITFRIEQLPTEGRNTLKLSSEERLKSFDLQQVKDFSQNGTPWNINRTIDYREHFEISSENGEVQRTSLFKQVVGSFDGITNRLQPIKFDNEHISESIATKPNQGSHEPFGATLEQCQSIKSGALKIVERHLAKMDPNLISKQVFETTRNTFEELFSDPDVVGKLVTVQALDADAFRHCLRVNSLAVIIGASMGYTSGQLKELGIATLLVDSGKMQVARKYIVNNNLLENDKSNSLMQLASKLSFERLWELKNSSDTVLQELNRADLDIPRENIIENNKLTEIYTLVDVYEVLMNEGMNGAKLMPHEVIEYIRDYYCSFFDPEVSRIFLQNITPFLAGSLVLLNNGEKARVIKANRELLARPVIQVLFDKDGHPLSEPIERDLKTDLTLFIVSALEDESGELE